MPATSVGCGDERVGVVRGCGLRDRSRSVRILLTVFRRPVTATRISSIEPTGGSHADLILGDMTEVLSEGLPGEGRDREEILPSWFEPVSMARPR